MAIHPSAPLRARRSPAQSDNTRGVILMALGFFAFSGTDLLAKLLTESLHPFQIVWFRLIGLFLGVLVLLVVKGPKVLRTAHPGIQISRGTLAAVSATLFIFGVSEVPLADATAVTFIAPFVVTVAGALVLKETVGMRRWLAVATGFVGMLIVIRPGSGVFDPAIFFIVLAALCFATRQILSRLLSGEDNIATTVAYTSISATVVISLAMPFVWITPSDSRVIAYLVGIAIAAAIGELLIIRALEMAQAVVVAPLQYSLIIWATLYGYLAFGDLPDHWTLIGCAIIVASGLFTLSRERLRARQKERKSGTASPKD